MTGLRAIAAAPRGWLTTSTSLDPAALLAEGRTRDPELDEDELALARLVASEHGRGTPAELACIADAELARARAKRMSVLAHLTGGAGKFGPQGGRRPASTRQNANMRHLAAARAVLSGELEGIALGAQRFFSPAGMEKAYRAYKAGRTPGKVHSCSALGLLRAWCFDLPPCTRGRRCCADGQPKAGNPGPNLEGWVGPIPGVDPFELMLMRPMRAGAEHEAAYAAAADIVRGRAPGPHVDTLVALLLLAVGVSRLVVG